MGNDRYLELIEAIESSTTKIDILVLAEVRRLGDKIIRTKNENLFCFTGTTPGMRGVGFIINSEWKDKIIEYKGINDRIASLKVKLPKNKTLTIIQVYAPAATTEEEEIISFYDRLNEEMEDQKINLKNQLVIMGDFNSQVGDREIGEENIMGPYTYGKRNDSGWKVNKLLSKTRFKNFEYIL